MRALILIVAFSLLTACSPEPGSERWCKLKEEQDKTEWSTSDALTYAKSCIIEGMAVGSREWCKQLAEKPKGDWSTNEATSYAKHCVI